MAKSPLKDGRVTYKTKLNFVLYQLKSNNIFDEEILELGSGSGWLTKELEERGYNITSFDKDNQADIQADFLEYDFGGKYKVIIALEFLEHGFFTEKVISILEKDGVLIASFPNPRFDGLMQFLSWNGIYNTKNKYHYLEHINLFYPEEVPLKLLQKKTILKICYMVCWKNQDSNNI